MIYQYIKANRKVAEHLGIATQRLQFPDGNYLLWKLDLMPLGGNNDDTLRMIGGVGMNSEQVRDEQRGITTTKLPVATDERFKIESQSEDNNEIHNGDQSDNADQSTDDSDQQQENDPTGEGNGESNGETEDKPEQDSGEDDQPEESDGTDEGE
jgi:hypothetical protein